MTGDCLALGNGTDSLKAYVLASPGYCASFIPSLPSSVTTMPAMNPDNVRKFGCVLLGWWAFCAVFGFIKLYTMTTFDLARAEALKALLEAQVVEQKEQLDQIYDLLVLTIHEAKTEVDDLTTKNQTLQTNANSSTKQIEQLLTDIETLKKTIESNDKQIAILSGNNVRLEAKVAQ